MLTKSQTVQRNTNRSLKERARMMYLALEQFASDSIEALHENEYDETLYRRATTSTRYDD